MEAGGPGYEVEVSLEHSKRACGDCICYRPFPRVVCTAATWRETVEHWIYRLFRGRYEGIYKQNKVKYDEEMRAYTKLSEAGSKNEQPINIPGNKSSETSSNVKQIEETQRAVSERKTRLNSMLGDEAASRGLLTEIHRFQEELRRLKGS